MNCTILKYKNEADIIRNKRMASCVFMHKTLRGNDKFKYQGITTQ